MKNGKGLKKVKGGLEGYFKALKGNKCSQNGYHLNGLNGHSNGKNKINGIAQNEMRNGTSDDKEEFNLQLKDVMDSVRKRMSQKRKLQISESEQESAQSYSEVEEDGSLDECEYDEGSDPEEMMYRQYLQTGDMVKKVGGEVVISLVKVDEEGYKLK